VIVLSAKEVTDLLPMAKAIQIIRKAMIGVANGEANLPLRSAIEVGGVNKLGIMPGVLKDGGTYGVKLLSLFPGNPANGLSSHIGAMVVFDPQTGAPSAMMSADALTAIRTAAASGAATDALARKDAKVLAIIGTGEQAESHITAMCAVREIKQVFVAGRSQAKADRFIERIAAHHPDLAFTSTPNAQTAVKDADIICTTTSAATPILFGEWLKPGAHVNAVGASMPIFQEIDQSVLTVADVFVDYRPSAFAQAREIIDALETGVITKADILAEIGEVYAGEHMGRSSPDAITLYRSLGVASQDLAAAEFVMEQAKMHGIGITASVT
jgi:ornithine cyclodeaminase/alanine dehydrogenase-like protein (mu-crystallin family)